MDKFFIMYIAAWNYLDRIGKELGQQYEGSMQQQIIYLLFLSKSFPRGPLCLNHIAYLLA